MGAAPAQGHSAVSPAGRSTRLNFSSAAINVDLSAQALSVDTLLAIPIKRVQQELRPALAPGQQRLRFFASAERDEGPNPRRSAP